MQPAGARVRASTPTFNKDIAPIVFANCAPCHRPGEVAPFPLLTYADAVEAGGQDRQGDARPSDAAVAAGSGRVPDRRRAAAARGPDRSDSALGERRQARRESEPTCRRRRVFPTAGGSASRTWSSRRRARTADGPAARRRVPQPRPSHAAEVGRRSCARSSSRPAARPSITPSFAWTAPRRSRRRDGEDGQPGFDGMAWGTRAGSRGPVRRLGAGPRADRLAGRHAVAARSRRRSRRRTARDCRPTSAGRRFSRRSACS